MYKDRKETIHREIGERTVITTSNVYISTITRIFAFLGLVRKKE